MVTDGDAGDLGADRLDDSRPFVSGDDRRGRERHLAPGEHVGVAHAGGHDPHEHLIGSGCGQLDGLEHVLPVGGPQDSSGDLQLTFLSSSSAPC